MMRTGRHFLNKLVNVLCLQVAVEFFFQAILLPGSGCRITG